MAIVDDTSLETVVAIFDVWLLLEALDHSTAMTYDFLRRPAVYESLRRPTRETPRPSTPAGIQVLGPSCREENRFWQQYAQIEPVTLPSWDRQEPHRLEVHDRVRIAPLVEAPRIVCHAPEVFVFPAGWSTTLWLRIVDEFALRDLPEVLWTLEGDPRITLTPPAPAPLTLSSTMDALRDRVGALLYGPSLRRRARRIIRQRVVALIDRDGPARDYQYLDEDLTIIYGALEPSEAGMGELWRMAQSSQQPQGRSTVIRYGRGLFLDSCAPKGDQKQHWRRCNARNLRNMIMMCAVLQATVKFGAVALPSDASTLTTLPSSRQEDIRLLHRLVSGSQRSLRRIPAAFTATAASFYFGHHKEIQEAVTLAVPAV